MPASGTATGAGPVQWTTPSAPTRKRGHSIKTLGSLLLVGGLGYAGGVVIGMILINLVSTNQHDRGAEAAMTGFFFSGPLVALLAVIVWFVLRLLRR